MRHRGAAAPCCARCCATPGVAGRPLEHFEILRHSSLPRQPREYFGDLDVDGGRGRMSATAPRVSQLRALEAEAVFVVREVVAELAQARAAVQRWQGLDRAAASRREGVPPAAAAVPGVARRHRSQLPRGDRVPRPAPARGRPPADRGLGPGVDRYRPRQGGDAGRLAQPPADGDAARCARAARVRRRVRRSPARRGAGARQGAGAVVPRRVRTVGAAGAARGAVDALQRADPARRAHPRVPAEQLDRARRVALHRGRGARAALDLLRPPPARARARRDAAGRVGVDQAASERAGRGGDGPLSHGRRPDGHRRGAVGGRRHRRR